MTPENITLDIGPMELLPEPEMFLDGSSLFELIEADTGIQAGRSKLGRPRGSGGRAKLTQIFTREELRENPILALSPEEYKTLRLHMQGLKIGEIADKLGMTEAGVRMRLQKPVVMAAKAYMMRGLDDDASALYQKALDVYRQGLDDVDKNYRLQCADRVMRVNGKDGKTRVEDSSSGNVAEVMKTIMDRVEMTMNLSMRSKDARSKQLNIDYTPESI